MQQIKERAVTETLVDSAGYKSLLVHVMPGAAARLRVEAAARLARDFGARLIGVAAETLDPLLYGDGYAGVAAGDLISLLQEQVTNDLKESEALFRREAAGVDSEWRSVDDYPTAAVARLARTADLVILGPRSQTARTTCPDPGEVALGAGRPVLIAPEARSHLVADAVSIAWKDTRECRRAIADAMPFLQRAEDVIVHAVARKTEQDAAATQIEDVLAYLKRHRVDARPVITSAAPEAVALEIERVATSHKADLIVSGAYGHSRLSEWAFGGVTRDFLHQPACFVLMSH